MYLNNRWHALKLLIEAIAPRLKDYTKDHWESMKCFIASDIKQKVVKNHAMKV
jgi:hypothetical protein